MAIIDSIKIGQPMPAIIPDQEARGDDIVESGDGSLIRPCRFPTGNEIKSL